MRDGTSGIERQADGQSDGSLSYTVVQTKYGHLYVVLARAEGRLLFDVRTLARSAAEAEAALAAALKDATEPGADPLAGLARVTPEELLARLMAALVERHVA